MTPQKKTVVIIGAGPAGLTAAYELVKHQGFHPIVIESSGEIGGISRTVNYKGYRMDIGGHRFFSKSDWVMNWWRDILPIESSSGSAGSLGLSYKGQQTSIEIGQEPGRKSDLVMLVRGRLSRIYYLRKFFDYPIKLSGQTLLNLGPVRVLKIGVSYTWAILFPRRPERSLEDFLINRFGNTLYQTFFKDYTEKVWGVPCDQISAEWGAQRIKGLSILKALKHAISKTFRGEAPGKKETATSLIENFLYPKLGPGQLWEEVARRISAAGGEVTLHCHAKRIEVNDQGVRSVTVVNQNNGKETAIDADYVISTMPVKDLIAGIYPLAPEHIRNIAGELPYRDFLTVGLLLKKFKRNPQSLSVTPNECPPDNWIYVQESDVRLGRIQVFNNWSPHLVVDSSKIWVGLEYFCQEGDDLWRLDSAAMSQLAIDELVKIGLIESVDVLDSHVVKVPKAYPAYFGAYEKFDEIRKFVDQISNLYLIGRNGMHRYNNQDHSMLTAKLAVDSICSGNTEKSSLWAINIDDDYHEEKTTPTPTGN